MPLYPVLSFGSYSHHPSFAKFRILFISLPLKYTFCELFVFLVVHTSIPSNLLCFFLELLGDPQKDSFPLPFPNLVYVGNVLFSPRPSSRSHCSSPPSCGLGVLGLRLGPGIKCLLLSTTFPENSFPLIMALRIPLTFFSVIPSFPSSNWPCGLWRGTQIRILYFYSGPYLKLPLYNGRLPSSPMSPFDTIFF